MATLGLRPRSQDSSVPDTRAGIYPDFDPAYRPPNPTLGSSPTLSTSTSQSPFAGTDTSYPYYSPCCTSRLTPPEFSLSISAVPPIPTAIHTHYEHILQPSKRPFSIETSTSQNSSNSSIQELSGQVFTLSGPQHAHMCEGQCGSVQSMAARIDDVQSQYIGNSCSSCDIDEWEKESYDAQMHLKGLIPAPLCLRLQPSRYDPPPIDSPGRESVQTQWPGRK